MPVFQVPIVDNKGEAGTITVNASDAQAAIENAGAQGNNTVPSGASATQVAAAPNAETSGMNYTRPGPTGGDGGGGLSAADQAALNQYAASQKMIMDAVASGNANALRESIRQFDLMFGLDRDKMAETIRQFNESLGVSAAGLTGTYQGQPTMQAQQQAFQQQLGLITTAAGLQANPFRQQAAMGQMGRLLGGQGVQGFGGLNTVPGAGTVGMTGGAGAASGGAGMGYLQQMIDDIRDPSTNTASMNNVLNAIPTPNKINSNEFLRSAPSTQSMVLQGMQEKYGLDPKDALAQINATLPQFQAPTTTGTLKR